MPEFVAMIPNPRPLTELGGTDLQVKWHRINVGSGTLYLPPDTDSSELNMVESGCIRVEELEVIGYGGTDKEFPATVYRTPLGNALRVISSSDQIGQGGLEWLRANLTLRASLGVASELDLFHQSMIDYFFASGVATPTYLGFLASQDLGSVYLMTDESENRVPGNLNIDDHIRTFGPYRFATEAVVEVFGEGWVNVDPTSSNCLLGEDDVIVLDAVPGPKLFKP